MKIPIKSERTNGVMISFVHHSDAGPKSYTFVSVEFNEDANKRICIFTGKAYLHPNDQYDKRIGRKLALSRALKNSDLSRDERRQIWEGLFAKGMKR